MFATKTRQRRQIIVNECKEKQSMINKEGERLRWRADGSSVGLSSLLQQLNEHGWIVGSFRSGGWVGQLDWFTDGSAKKNKRRKRILLTQTKLAWRWRVSEISCKQDQTLEGDMRKEKEPCFVFESWSCSLSKPQWHAQRMRRERARTKLRWPSPN